MASSSSSPEKTDGPVSTSGAPVSVATRLTQLHEPNETKAASHCVSRDHFGSILLELGHDRSRTTLGGGLVSHPKSCLESSRSKLSWPSFCDRAPRVGFTGQSSLDSHGITQRNGPNVRLSIVYASVAARYHIPELVRRSTSRQRSSLCASASAREKTGRTPNSLSTHPFSQIWVSQAATRHASENQQHVTTDIQSLVRAVLQSHSETTRAVDSVSCYVHAVQARQG